jgi:flagellar protein FliS
MNNNSNILNIYKKVIKSGDLQKNPHEIVKLVLTELSRTMKIISDDIGKKKGLILKEDSSDLINIQKSISKNVSRSLTTIYSLQTSLDFDKGGKIASGLFQIYEYCRVQIIKGFSKSINDGIIKAKNALDQILLAWSSMETKSI